ncbi:MAG: tetratricopeptide repeat protein, partial [Lachnospiraceae bacterium]|nr:tetratricopeptide repeat protein [Lachnospiraceae bacterium]
MYCTKCGHKIVEGGSFCGNCGQRAAAETPVGAVGNRPPHPKTLRIALLVVVGALLLAGAAGASVWMASYRDYEAAALKPLTAEGFLDLGEKYLLDLDYEQALVQFDLVIIIEPRNPRGYTGAAEAYMGMGDIDSAIAVLRQGLEVLPDSAEIQAMLAELTKPSEP